MEVTMKTKCFLKSIIISKHFNFFHFQVRESPAPLNIPTPSPSSTTPVWCRGGSRYVEGCSGIPYLKIKKV